MSTFSLFLSLSCELEQFQLNDSGGGSWWEWQEPGAEQVEHRGEPLRLRLTAEPSQHLTRTAGHLPGGAGPPHLLATAGPPHLLATAGSPHLLTTAGPHIHTTAGQVRKRQMGECCVVSRVAGLLTFVAYALALTAAPAPVTATNLKKFKWKKIFNDLLFNFISLRKFKYNNFRFSIVAV